VQPIQQFAYTTRKNSTDSALIIDAMDLLHGGTVDGFCLVSSDSDFTRLAARIRGQGLMADGFGQRKTPKPFVAASTMFIYVENLAGKEVATKQKATPEATATATKAKPTLRGDAELTDLLKAHPGYDVESRSTGDGKPKVSVVRSKPRK